MIMDVLARGIMDISPWCMLYADDIVLCGTRSEVVEKKLEEWRRDMEDRGLKINIRREESDGDGGAWEKKERKTKAEVVG